jgi:hypothetical protein
VSAVGAEQRALLTLAGRPHGTLLIHRCPAHLAEQLVKSPSSPQRLGCR